MEEKKKFKLKKIWAENCDFTKQIGSSDRNFCSQFRKMAGNGINEQKSWELTVCDDVTSSNLYTVVKRSAIGLETNEFDIRKILSKLKRKQILLHPKKP